MPRKPVADIARECVPEAPHSGCADGMCFDMEYPRCWADFFANVDSTETWRLPAVQRGEPVRVVADLDDQTYAVLAAEAASHGVTISCVVRAALRDWAGREGK
jgi:hypothetical protein